MLAYVTVRTFYCENQPDPSHIFHGDFLSVMMRVLIV